MPAYLPGARLSPLVVAGPLVDHLLEVVALVGVATAAAAHRWVPSRASRSGMLANRFYVVASEAAPREWDEYFAVSVVHGRGRVAYSTSKFALLQ